MSRLASFDLALAQATLARALRHGGTFAELFVERLAQTQLVRDDGRLDRASAGCDQGAGLRVVRGDACWFANTNDLSAEGLGALADQLAEAVAGAEGASAAAHGTAAATVPPVAPLASVEVLSPDPPVARWPDEVGADELAACAARADRAARAHDPRVAQATISLVAARRSVFLANSEGRAVAQDTPYLTLAALVVARAGDAIRSGYHAAAVTRGFEFLEAGATTDEAAANDAANEAADEAAAVAREAARLAVLQLEAGPAPSGTMPVVLSSRAGGTMVHEACGHGLEADFYLKNLSIYSGRLGEKVAADGVTVVDDGTLAGRRGTSAVDDEGVPARRVVLIENGVLVGLLQARETARRLGADPTGNGRRESYRHLPLPRMRNTFIAPGPDDPDAIVASVADGLFVARMGGGEVDIVSGNFVFHCTEAYRIRDGRLAEPVRDAVLTGNGPAVLASIDRVGRDLGWSTGTCGKDGQGVPVADAQPTLRIPALVVGGTGRA